MKTARTILIAAICLIPKASFGQSCHIEPAQIPAASAGVRYELQFSLKGTTLGDPTFTATSVLPPGLTLTAAGLLSGTPTQGGTFRFSLTAKAFSFLLLSNCEAPITYDLTVVDRRCRPITLPGSMLYPPQAEAGSYYSYQLAATGGSAPYSYGLSSGSLPAGLRLDPSGLISGSPSGPDLGRATVAINDGNGCTASADLSLASYQRDERNWGPSPLNRYAVSVSGNTAVVGDGGRAVHVLRWDGMAWQEEPIQQPADLQPGDQFGVSVAATDERVAVGTRGSAVYVFRRSSGQWVQEARLPGFGQFGLQLAMSGTDLIVLDGVSGVFVYSWNGTWGTAQQLTTDRVGGVAIGAGFAAAGGSSGTCLVWERTSEGWTALGALIGDAGDTICSSVAISGDTMVASGRLGTAYFFDHVPRFWALRAKLQSPGAHSGPVALHGNTALIASDWSTYVAQRSAGTWRIVNRIDRGNFAVPTAPWMPVAISGNTIMTGTPSQSAFFTRCPAGPRPVTNWRGIQGARASLRAADDLPAGLQDYVAVDGLLPPGMTLGTDGMISGTPTAAGSYGFTVVANDAAGCSVAVPVRLVVDPPCQPFFLTSAPLPSGIVNQPYSGRLRGLGGTVAPDGSTNNSYRFDLGMAPLPAGLRLAADGSLTGTPSRAGTYSFQVQVRDAGACPAATLPVTLVVFPSFSPPPFSDSGSGSAAADGRARAVAISGTTAILGVPGALNGRGSAEILVKAQNGWIRQAVLTADGDGFGSSVAISGDRVIIGAPNDEDHRGAAYIFERGASGWNQIARLTAPDGSAGDQFGFAVGISADSASVGAPYAAMRRGTVYTFVRQPAGWSPETTLEPADNGPHNFGFALSQSGDNLAIGMPGNDAMFTGGAYLCSRWPAWTCQPFESTVSGDRAGEAVAISGSRALIGIPSSGFVASVSQAPGGGWAFDPNIDTPDPSPGVRFGGSLSLNGSTAIIGAPGKGSAYLYVFDTSAGRWVPQAELTSPLALDYGAAVGIAGHTAVVGSSNSTFQILERCPDSRIAIGPDRVTGAAQGVGYNASFSAQGGDEPYLFDFSEGAPPGLLLSPLGAMTGKPSATGAFPFTVTARDRNGCTGSRTYSLLVDSGCGGLSIGPDTLLTAIVGTAYSQRLTAQGGAAPYTFTINTGLFGAGSLPAGFQLSPSGEITGVPVNPGSFNVAVRVRDANGCETVKAYQLIVAASATSRVLRVVPAGAGPGDNVAVDIELTAQGDETTIGFSLRYDPAALGEPRAVLGRDVGVGAQLNVNAAQAASGRIGLLLALPQGRTIAAGARRIVTVTFRINTAVMANSTDLAFDDTPVVRELTNAAAGVLPTTFASGAVTISRGPEADVSPRPNGNGSVTAADYAQMGRFVAGIEKPENGSEFQRADCAPKETRGDGRITMEDWIQAGRYADGTDAPVPAAGPMEPVAPGSGGGMMKAPKAAREAGRTPATISLEQAGESFRVTLDAAGVESGLAFSLLFDPAAWRFVSVSPGADAGAAMVVFNDAGALQGQLRVALAHPPGMRFAAGRREVVSLVLERASSQAEPAPVTVSGLELVDSEARPMAVAVKP